ncbi:MAG: homoserine kinase [Chitinophagales bacterium]
MAHYTKLNQETLAQLLQQEYGMEVDSYGVLSGGSQNTNYWVKTSNQTFVLTVCEQKILAQAEELAQLLAYLNANGFATSEVIPTIGGGLATVFEGKPILLKSFIEGSVEKDLSPELLVTLGQQLARLHQIPAPDYLPKSLSSGIEAFDEIKLYAPESEFYVWSKETRTYIEGFLEEDMPKALIHSDIFFNNIIIHPDGKQTTIMDFEEACHYYRVFDIGMMLVGSCSEGIHLNPLKTQSLLKGYQQISPLSSTEKKALQAFTVYGAAATALWRHQNFNYVHVIPEMKDHYRAMKDLADSVRGMEAEVWFGGES